MSPTQTLPSETTAAPAPSVLESIDRQALVRLLHEKDRHIQELETECRGLAEQLMAFQAEILKWVDLER